MYNFSRFQEKRNCNFLEVLMNAVTLNERIWNVTARKTTLNLIQFRDFDIKRWHTYIHTLEAGDFFCCTLASVMRECAACLRPADDPPPPPPPSIPRPPTLALSLRQRRWCEDWRRLRSSAAVEVCLLWALSIFSWDITYQEDLNANGSSDWGYIWSHSGLLLFATIWVTHLTTNQKPRVTLEGDTCQVPKRARVAYNL